MAAVVVAAIVGGLTGAAAVGLKLTALKLAQAIFAYAVLAATTTALQLALAKDPEIPTLAASTATRTVRAARLAARWVVGRARVGGHLVMLAESANGRTLYVGLVLAEGPIESVDRAWMDGDEWNGLNPDVEVADDDRRHANIRIRFSLDGLGRAGDGLAMHNTLRSATSEWTTAHELKGVAWALAEITQPTDGERVWLGLPRLEFLVKGLKLTWPGQTDPTWTDNAAAIRYWWLRQRRALPAAAIHDADFAAAYTVCEQEITVELPDSGFDEYDATRKRYTVDGVISSTDDRETIEQQLDFAWAGFAPSVDGVYRFRPGVERAADVALGPADLLNIESIQVAPALQDRVNAVTVGLQQSRAHDWDVLTMPEYTDAAIMTRDGERLPLDLGVKYFVSDPVAAGYLVAVALRRARAGAVFSYRVAPGAAFRNLSIIQTDRITITDPEHGFAALPCVVTNTKFHEDWSATLTLHEAPAGIYADTLVLPPPVPRPLTIPTERTPPPAFVFVVVTPRGDVVADGTIRSSVRLSWGATEYGAQISITSRDDPTAPALQLTVPRGISSATQDLPEPGNYTARLWPRSRHGVLGPEHSEDFAISWLDLPPPAPVLLTMQSNSGIAQLTLAAAPNRDISGIEIRHNSTDVENVDDLAAITAADWGTYPRLDVTALVASVGGAGLVATVAIPATGRYRLAARYITRQGLYGPVADFGERIFTVNITAEGSIRADPDFAGTLTNAAILMPPDPLTPLLIYDPSSRDISRARWDGVAGWPWGFPLPAETGVFAAPAFDLGAARDIQARVTVEEYEALAPAIPANSAITAEVLQRATEMGTPTVTTVPVNGGWVQLPIAARFASLRLTIGAAHQGRALQQVALHYRDFE